MGESGGRSGWCNVEEEEDDLEQILKYVRKTLKPPHDQILAIIGHSKGATVGLMFGSQPSFQDISQPQLYDERARTPLLVALSARYDTKDTGLSRFTPEQQAQLEKDGQFVWLRYRAGPSNEEAREYVVTKEAVEHAKHRTLECVKDLPSNCHVLLLHGRADGTVRCKETEKIDQQIRRGSPDASVDLIWVEGVKHNWDEDGEIEMVTDWINSWIKRRAGRDSSRVPEDKICDHLRLQRDQLKH